MLLLGPIVAYIGLGVLWLRDHGLALYGFAAWLACSVLFGLLSVRWTQGKHRQAVLPPLDWNAPETFAPLDRTAWSIVEEAAGRAESLDVESLTQSEIYLEAGRTLAHRLARHYHPKAEDPLSSVAFADLLTALELVAEDLGQLVREVPGGDLVTPGHWKSAVAAAGWVQKFNEAYSYLMPIVEPLTGLVRLSSQKLVTERAWRGMRQNLLRWFYRAFINRLGFHLVELYSGRLSMGAATYRALRGEQAVGLGRGLEVGKLVPEVRVVGRDAERLERIQAAVSKAWAGTFAAGGSDSAMRGVGAEINWAETRIAAVKLKDAGRAELVGRDREAASQALESDLLILDVDVVGGIRPEAAEAFLGLCAARLANEPRLIHPPVLTLATGFTPGDARLAAIEARQLGPVVCMPAVVAGLAEVDDLSRVMQPAIRSLGDRVRQVLLIRRFRELAGRSKAGRFVRQLGDHSKRLLGGLINAQQTRHGGSAGREETARRSGSVDP